MQIARRFPVNTNLVQTLQNRRNLSRQVRHQNVYALFLHDQVTQFAVNVHILSLIHIYAELCERANHLGREFVIQITGEVNERSNKNMNIPTGEIEIIVSVLNVLNSAVTPPFTIEDNSDGGDDIRMKFRYLDLRRNCVRKNLELRHKMTMEVRRYLDSKGFLEVETPMLVGSTPEGARDFVVPSRMNPGQFYALPQLSLIHI